MTTNALVSCFLLCTTSIGYAIAFDRGAAIGLAIGSAAVTVMTVIADVKR